jgi:hypothetical protein
VREGALRRHPSPASATFFASTRKDKKNLSSAQHPATFNV